MIQDKLREKPFEVLRLSLMTTANIDFLHRQTMFDKQSVPETSVSATDILAGMRDTGRVYLVHAAVSESVLHAAEPDESLLQKLVRRRLVRLERVVAALSGKVVRQMPRGLLAEFQTAEAAVLGAGEMQRRCAVIPQISETQIALKIGIQSADARPRSGNSIDLAEIAAIKFASILGEGSIVVSDAVASELPTSLSAAVSPVDDAGIDVVAHVVNWQMLPMLRLPSPTAQKTPEVSVPAAHGQTSITFSLDGIECSFGHNHPVITIGRDSGNDITVIDPKASRQHCKIIYQRDGYVLVDVSTNGTFMAFDGGKPRIVRKTMLNLPHSGYISLGHPSLPGESTALKFDIKTGNA